MAAQYSITDRVQHLLSIITGYNIGIERYLIDNMDQSEEEERFTPTVHLGGTSYSS
jgi:hypothetical protein